MGSMEYLPCVALTSNTGEVPTHVALVAVATIPVLIGLLVLVFVKDPPKPRTARREGKEITKEASGCKPRGTAITEGGIPVPTSPPSEQGAPEPHPALEALDRWAKSVQGDEENREARNHFAAKLFMVVLSTAFGLGGASLVIDPDAEVPLRLLGFVVAVGFLPTAWKVAGDPAPTPQETPADLPASEGDTET
jgi:hypothetical protein